MTIGMLIHALRRDDLVQTARAVDLVSTVYESRDLRREESVILVDACDGSALMQALEICDDYDVWGNDLYVYVPLMHGPVQEVV